MSHPDETKRSRQQSRHDLPWSASQASALRTTRPGLPDRHNFLTLFGVVASESITTLKSRTMSQLFSHRRSRPHKHNPALTYAMVQRLGVPYEVERTVCTKCRQVLDERPLKRAAA